MAEGRRRRRAGVHRAGVLAALPGHPQGLVRARLRLRQRLRAHARGLGGPRQRPRAADAPREGAGHHADAVLRGRLQGRLGAADEPHHRRLGPALPRRQARRARLLLRRGDRRPAADPGSTCATPASSVATSPSRHPHRPPPRPKARERGVRWLGSSPTSTPSRAACTRSSRRCSSSPAAVTTSPSRPASTTSSGCAPSACTPSRSRRRSSASSPTTGRPAPASARSCPACASSANAPATRQQTSPPPSSPSSPMRCSSTRAHGAPRQRPNDRACRGRSRSSRPSRSPPATRHPSASGYGHATTRSADCATVSRAR